MLDSSRIHVVLAALAAVALMAPGHTSASVAAGTEADTVVVVVSAENPVEEIPRRALADIYLGRSNTFPDGSAAVPVDQKPGSPARRAFYETFLGRSPSEVKAHWSKMIFTGRGRPPEDLPDGEAVKERVAGDPNAIGYLDHRLVDGSVHVVEVE